jgi:hypothetical protein
LSGRWQGTPHTAARPGAGRQCDALLDVLARRQLSPSVIRRDPALLVLSVLAADVDGPAVVTGAARRAAARHLAAWRARQVAARHARLAARASATRQVASAARNRAGVVPGSAGTTRAGRGTAAWPVTRPRPAALAALAGSVLAAFMLAVVALGSTGLLAAGLLGRLARLGTGVPPGHTHGAARSRHSGSCRRPAGRGRHPR